MLDLAPIALIDELSDALRSWANANGRTGDALYPWMFGGLIAELSEDEARRILATVTRKLGAPSVAGRAVAL